MKSTSLTVAHKLVNGVHYVNKLQAELPDFLITARLMSIDESSTNTDYDVWIARKSKTNGNPTIIRDWTMRGAYRPVAGGEKMFNHRANYGATTYTQGGEFEHNATANMLLAVFDSLLGSCDIADSGKISEYVEVANAMYFSGLAGAITSQYKASIVTPNNHLTGTRIWALKHDGFHFLQTNWVYSLNSNARFTMVDHGLVTTATKALKSILHTMHSATVQMNAV